MGQPQRLVWPANRLREDVGIAPARVRQWEEEESSQQQSSNEREQKVVFALFCLHLALYRAPAIEERTKQQQNRARKADARRNFYRP